MSKFLNAGKLEELKLKKKAQETKLAGLMDLNVNPIQDVEEAANKLPTLRPFTTGDPVRDIVGINHQLNNLPEHFDKCNEKQLREAWEGAEKIGRAAAWIKGHILLTMNRKYKEGAVKKFSDEMGVTHVTAYNFIHLAELFPKVDPVLEPTFHFKAISLAHGDKEKAIQLIEQAKEKKLADPKYSVRNFIEDSTVKGKAKGEHKSVNIATIAGKAIKNLRLLVKHSDLAEIREDIKEMSRLIEKINQTVQKGDG